MKTKLAVLVLLISSVGWGLTWLPLKYLNESGLDGLQLILIAFVSGALVLSPWLIRQYAEWKSSLVFMALIGLAGGFANVSFQTAIYHGDVIRVMILFYLLPVWSVIGGKIFLKEKIDTARIIAVTLCLTGAFVILDVWHSSWQGISWIDLLAIGSGIGLAATNILFRLTTSVPVKSKVAAMFIGCAFLTALAMTVFTTTVTMPEQGSLLLAAAYGAIWLTLITLGTQWGVTQIEAGRSAIIIVMELVAAVVSVAIITATDLKVYEIVGGLLVISAAVIEGSRADDDELLPAEAA